MEVLAQEDGAGSLVGLKLVGDGNSKLPRRLIFGHGEVMDILRYGAVDVVKEPELAAHRLEEGRPLPVVGAVEFQLDGDMGCDRDRGVGVEEEGAGHCIRRGGHGWGARGGRRGC